MMTKSLQMVPIAILIPVMLDRPNCHMLKVKRDGSNNNDGIDILLGDYSYQQHYIQYIRIFVVKF